MQTIQRRYHWLSTKLYSDAQTRQLQRESQNPVDAAAASQRGIRGERRRQRPEDADDHCPGTQSEAAGKAEACAGRPNQQVCSKGRAVPRRCAVKWGSLSLGRRPWIPSSARQWRKGDHVSLIGTAAQVLLLWNR
ncbi:hypothetical protein GQ55_7G188900 [Panicum hallii var. hallii]|uniref:Uncharacterized protein n=1 Tax=Panicum hallii var. hallii TaxID=1504633 RepID=A0A2T7CWJ1_9POAL|nr:hypothetical protein GQ55_7G188900 [Panicum hallii var. hallii]